MNAAADRRFDSSEASANDRSSHPEESGAHSFKAISEAMASADTLLSGNSGVSQVRFGRYDLIERVGRGGMGEVFRAYDRELMEEVALKILRGSFGAHGDVLALFHREVRLARRISHRNVARTYEFGMVNGTPYLTMEFVRGERLDDRLRRQGRLSEQEALHIATELCLGLDAAHAAGVIHRDIKPDNVIIAHDGRIVITDFGVARQLGDEVTHTNGIAGTPTYMAPEQVTGGPITTATDVYAVTVVLYELLTGRAPWVAEGAYATALARLFKAAPDPRTLVPTLSSSVAELLTRCLATTGDQRIATATELHAAIQALSPEPLRSLRTGPHSESPTSAPAPQPRVVVLPFSTRSETDRLVAEGLAEDLAGELSRARELRVVSFERAARQAWDDPKTAGTELGADLVVEGSVRRAGELLRINARLLRVSDGSAVWSQRFDCAPGSVLSLQARIARQLGSALGCELPAEGPTRPELATDALQLYLECRAAFHSFDAKRLVEAQHTIERAHALCPNDPMLLSMDSLLKARTWVAMRNPEARLVEQAIQSAHVALVQNDTFAEAHLALGYAEYVRGNSVAAAKALRAALVRAPGLGEAQETLGLLLLESERIDEGLSRLAIAHRLNPELRSGLWELARAQELLGNTGAASNAIGMARHGSSRPHEILLPLARLASWRRAESAPAGIRAELESWNPRDAEEREVKWFIRTLLDLHFGGNGSAGLFRPFVDLLIGSAQRPGTSPRRAHFCYQLIAEVCVRRGDDEGALLAVERMAQTGLHDGIWLKHCPLLEPLRSHTRFRAVERAAHEHSSALADEIGP